jgi:hypothetical protein
MEKTGTAELVRRAERSNSFSDLDIKADDNVKFRARNLVARGAIVNGPERSYNRIKAQGLDR